MRSLSIIEVIIIKKLDELLNMARANEKKYISFVNTDGEPEKMQLILFILRYLNYAYTRDYTDIDDMLPPDADYYTTHAEIMNILQEKMFISPESMPDVIEQLKANEHEAGTLVALVLYDIEEREANGE